MTRVSARGLLGLSILLLSSLPVPAEAAFPQNAKVQRKATGKVHFIGSAPGKPIARPAGYSASSAPEAVGKAFLEQHASDFGLGRASAVRAVRSARQPKGATAVRYQQTIGGIEVLAGEFVVQLDDQNRVLSVLGEAESASVGTDATLSAAQAEALAVEAVAKHQRVHAARLSTGDSGLRIFNDAILGGPGGDRPQLVWATTVSDGHAVRRMVLVDAHRGGVLASIDMAPEAKTRTVCDGENNPAGMQLPCTAPVLLEGGTYAGAVDDVQAAYDYSGATYDFLMSRFGRDSLDGAGMALKSTVRYCDPIEPCPFVNAFWNGQQMVYGNGFASADDVVGHELAHGLTEFTSGLYYYYQSGAINESMSDVFGELIDHETESPDDTPTDRWKMGETLPIGAIRHMADPTVFGDPDSMVSPNYWTQPGDAGGVHINSGVNNKAAYLLVDGGTFGGVTVSAIGAEKVAQIYYAVQTGFLTSGSDYKDLGLALGQACDNLIGTHSISSGDCQEVRDAVTATAMLIDRPEAADMPECPVGQSPRHVYLDEITASGDGWTTSGTEPTWFLDNLYATSGLYSLYGPDYPFASDFSIAQTGARTIPPNAFLRFSHAYGFERSSSVFYDGGVVEVSANGGPWTDVVPAAAYPGTLDAGNPLGARKAFVGDSGGYKTAVVPLTGLSGQSARFRFRIGTDSAVGGFGWDVDDVGLYTCVAPAAPAVVTLAASSITPAAATVSGTVDPNALATTYRVQYGTNGSLDLQTSEVSAGSGADEVPVQVTLGSLQPSTQYAYRIVATNSQGTTEGATLSFTTAAADTGGPTGTTSGATTDPTTASTTAPAPVITTGPAPAVTPQPPLPLSLRGTARATTRRVKSARVICTNASATKVTCKITFPGAKRKRRVSGTLKLLGETVARGGVRKANATGLVTLTGKNGMLPGAYTLAVKVGSRTFKFKVALR